MVDKSRVNDLNQVKYIPVDNGELKPIREEKKSDTFYFYFVVITGMFGIMAVVPIFITEICENHNRAKYGCLVGLFSPLGNLYSYILGPLFSVKVFTLISNIPAVIFLVSFIFAPESPFFSVSKGKDKDCIKTLKKLRNNKSDLELHKDFSEITKSIEIKVNTVNPGISALFKIREARVGLFLIFIPMMTQFLSGAPTLMPFVGPIFNKAATSLSGNTIAIIVGAVKCFVFVIPTFIVERTGRKPLMICSSLGCSVSMILVGTYFYLQHISSPLAQQLSWLPIISVIIVVFSYAAGLGPVPMSLTGELFATDTRAAASAITMTVAGFAVFAVATIFPIAAELIGLHWCFWLFSINCLIGAISIYFFLPETKGRSLVEIQDILKNYKFGFQK
ncbi:unnamed protein product [Diabrotica balteata]|uniref:Major facilitator superfamily (MFS) profile domain-containing protein n=1 Tax=Diabrotica balteata TaxID=107213 RepID=A0A9N9SU50_DIABA|nr:unnamed protein product [Diabrotica balteata]